MIAPRIAVAGGLWWYGSLYIMQSKDNEAVILATVAVNFVLDVPEQLYRCVYFLGCCAIWSRTSNICLA